MNSRACKAGALPAEPQPTVFSPSILSTYRFIDSLYFAYYQRSRTHLVLGKDAPQPRAVEPPEQGRVVAIPQVGGLHHRYQRFAA
jgi:hypothetical protein